MSPPAVTTLDGKKVVVHAGKTGWLYVVDAATGKLVRKSQNFVPQENMFALPTEKGTRMLPAPTGARNGRRSRSIRRSTTPSWPRCTSR